MDRSKLSRFLLVCSCVLGQAYSYYGLLGMDCTRPTVDVAHCGTPLESSCILVDKADDSKRFIPVGDGEKIIIDVSKHGFGDCYKQVTTGNVSDVNVDASTSQLSGVLVKDVTINNKKVPAGSKLYWCESGGRSVVDLINSGALAKDTLWNKISSYDWMRQEAKFLVSQTYTSFTGLVSSLYSTAFSWCLKAKNSVMSYIYILNETWEAYKSRSEVG